VITAAEVVGPVDDVVVGDGGWARVFAGFEANGEYGVVEVILFFAG
jgi:hypothetical protein